MYIILYINFFCSVIFVCAATAAKLRQSCPTLWDPIDGSPPGCPVPGILQARTLEWVAISLMCVCEKKKKTHCAFIYPQELSN